MLNGSHRSQEMDLRGSRSPPSASKPPAFGSQLSSSATWPVVICPAGIVPCAEAPASSPSSPSPTSHSQDILPAACSHNFRFSSFICARASPKLSSLHISFTNVLKAEGRVSVPIAAVLLRPGVHKSGVIGEFLISIALVDAI